MLQLITRSFDIRPEGSRPFGEAEFVFLLSVSTRMAKARKRQLETLDNSANRSFLGTNCFDSQSKIAGLARAAK